MKLNNLNVDGKKVLLRVDFNVPLDPQQHIVDPSRIDAALPTIRYLLNKGASLIIMSHLGRPKGKKNPHESLKPCADYLRSHLSHSVKMAPDCIGKETQKMAAALKPGEILVLENLRFHMAEEKPDSDPSFAKQLAQLGDCYVNDAFGAAHRKHSSTYTILDYFSGQVAIGLLAEKEIHFLGEMLHHPKRPFYALIGGAKISSKLGVLHSLLDKVDALFIGGAMSYTFMKAQGIEIGKSLFEKDLIPEANAILEKAKKKNVPLYLPQDVVALSSSAKTRIVSVREGFALDEEGVDIGPATLKLYGEKIKEAKTLFWNGPFGKYEDARFAKGTLSLLKEMASLGVTTIIGGGDLVAAASQANVEGQITHISTGGGASLEFIEEGSLPALAAITK